jgi:hypothetical protein
MVAVVYEVVSGDYEEMVKEADNERLSESLENMLVTIQNLDRDDLLVILPHLIKTNKKTNNRFSNFYMNANSLRSCIE